MRSSIAIRAKRCSSTADRAGGPRPWCSSTRRRRTAGPRAEAIEKGRAMGLDVKGGLQVMVEQYLSAHPAR